MPIYIGIDNGLTGGLVALSDVAGLPPIAKLPMPCQAKAKGNEIDIAAVWRWIQELHAQDMTLVMEQPGGSKNYKAAVSMADSFGALRALAELKGLRHHRITPQKWQKEILPNCPAGETKSFALAVVKRLWPEESWLATPRCKKPSEGLIDAALIAEYARSKQL